MTLGALLFLALGAAAADDAPAPSTATARSPAPLENRWALSYGLDRRGGRYGRLDYRLRWSFDDFDRSSDGSERAGKDHATPWRGILQSSNLELYGVRVRLFRDLPLRPASDFALAPSTAAANNDAPAPAPSRRRRLYTWNRLYEDLESSARREAERFVVKEGFDRTLPAHKGASYGQKKALGEGLLELGRGAFSGDAPER
jgi:hypothetical protein